MIEKDTVAFSVDAAGKAVARSVSVRKPVGDQVQGPCATQKVPDGLYASNHGITMLRPVIRHGIVQMKHVAVFRSTKAPLVWYT